MEVRCPAASRLPQQSHANKNGQSHKVNVFPRDGESAGRMIATDVSSDAMSQQTLKGK
tara:strand:+ start:1802 stop:1975 length:174 start_codon:yes stop_codon:yes gene_type:complete